MRDKILKNENHKYLILIIIIVAIYIVTPVAFARDGLLTKLKVEEFNSQFDFGSTRRHDQDIKEIYLVYFGFGDVIVEDEIMYKGYRLEVKKVFPFIYKWDINKSSTGVYRVTIGKKKYYYTYAVT